MAMSGTTNDNEWFNEWQRVTMSGAASDKEWQGVTKQRQWVTANDSEWSNEWIRMRVNKIEWFYLVPELFYSIF